MAEPVARVRSEPPPGWITLASGIHVRKMVEGNATAIDLYQMEPGGRFEPHRHHYAELGVVLSGRGTLRIGGEDRLLREGDSFYIPGDIPHGFVVESARPVVLLNVTVPKLPDVAGPTASEVLRVAAEAARSGPNEPVRVRAAPRPATDRSHAPD